MGETDAEDTETMAMIDFDDTATVAFDDADTAMTPVLPRMRTHADWPPTPPAPGPRASRSPRRAGVYPTASPR